MRVLVAEDNPTVRSVLCELLHDGGIDFVATENCREALRRIARDGVHGKQFDWYLFDYQLSDGTALDLFNVVQLPPVRVILLTAAGNDPELMQRATTLGIPHLYTKPEGILDVLDLLRRDLASRDMLPVRSRKTCPGSD
jgi:CheY-like chemotaxis protein